MTSPRRPWAGRLLALLCILLSAFNLRTAVTSLTPLLDSLGRTFGFGSTMTGVFGMVPTAAFAAFAVLTPAIMRRIGLERTGLLAMLLATSGLLGRSLADSTGALLAGSIVALAGMGIGNVAVPPLVKRYFADRVGPVSALYITVLQLGTMLPALAAVPLAQAVGWRVSLGVWSLLAATAAVSWLALMRQQRARSQAQYTPSGEGTLEAAPASPALVAAGRVWRSPLAWGLGVMFGMTSLVTYAMFTWLPKLLADAGASEAFGGAMTALFAGLGLLGALLVPGWAVRVRNPFVLVAACALANLAAFAGLWSAPMRWPLLWVVLLGLGGATFPLALTLINLRTRTPAGSAALSGFTQSLGYSLSCAGPLLFGLLHALSGGWSWSFGFFVLCTGALLAGAWQACRPRMLEDQWH